MATTKFHDIFRKRKNMSVFKFLLMFALFTAIPAPSSDMCEPDINKKFVEVCDEYCKESGKTKVDHDCMVRQCQEKCKKLGGDEVMWYQFTATSTPNNYQCCKSKTPEQAQKTQPSCATCKLVNEPAPAQKTLNVVLG